MALVLLFVMAGLAVIPYAGIQNDEALFGSAIYAPGSTADTAWILGRQVSTMLMSYLGSLKAWIYKPLLILWAPSIYSLRVPVLLMGAATIWLMYVLTLQLAGVRAAMAVSALLATDATFLYSTCFDWGPVALQHLLAVSAVLILLRFHHTGSAVALGAGFLLLGLALWDKALFGWNLVGLSFGLLCANPGAVRRAISWRNLCIAAICFMVGAAPLLRYNLRSRGETLRSNLGWSADPRLLLAKAEVMRATLEGTGMMGYISVADPSTRTRAPRTSLESLSVGLDKLLPGYRGSWLIYVLGAALMALPLVWNTPVRQVMVFALLVGLVVWAQMLFGAGVGFSVHHTALLWPWPHFFAAIVMAEVSKRWTRAGKTFLAAILTLTGASNMLAWNAQCSQFIRNGPTVGWTDALPALSSYLGTVPARQYVMLDWGMIEPLRLLHRGRVPLGWAGDVAMNEPRSEAGRRQLRTMLEDSGNVYVTHAEPNLVIPEVNRRFATLAESEGYCWHDLAMVKDSLGRTIFIVFRVVPADR
jgi:4-amino-4-deoxy-L-arabinose transferase-like glycosyltransferase